MNTNRYTSLRALSASAAAVAGLLAGPSLALACADGDFRGEAVTLEREVGATPTGETAQVQIMGAGWFRAAEVYKRGGVSDNTYVTLELDGESIITTSFAALKNPWMQLSTPFIVAKVESRDDGETMTIWYSPELKFTAIAVLRIEVDEQGVEGLRMRTVMNKPIPHAHLLGQPGAVAALPAFK